MKSPNDYDRAKTACPVMSDDDYAYQRGYADGMKFLADMIDIVWDGEDEKGTLDKVGTLCDDARHGRL